MPDPVSLPEGLSGVESFTPSQAIAHSPATVEPAPQPSLANLGDPAFYINRELSQLAFFRRVLEEAQDETNPLLERVKFLAIVGSNLDQFFMVRVAGLKQRVEAGAVEVSDDGLTPAKQLALIREAAQALMTEARQCLQGALLPQLAAAGVLALDYAALNEEQRARCKQYFDEAIFPVLTPLGVDPGRPFPHISNLSLNLAVRVRDARGQDKFARVKVPDTLPRLAPVPLSAGSLSHNDVASHNLHFVWLEQIIAANIALLFPGLTVVAVHPFRVVRDTDLTIQELKDNDLLETVAQTVRDRRFGSVVKLTVNPSMPVRLRELLINNLDVQPQDVYCVEGPLGLGDLIHLAAVDRPDLKAPPGVPAAPAALRVHGQDLFAALRLQQDILLHHPYDSFVPVVDFLHVAARDPGVLAIKQTLYRVGRDSPVVEALLEARQNGKQVDVIVELKARFDEASNIRWAKRLEAEGAHVAYGPVGLKTHAQVALVERREDNQLRRYVHLATGHYNSTTAQTYTDLGLFTCDAVIGTDVASLFNYLTGASAPIYYHQLLVAPVNLRARLKVLIQREIQHQQKGRPGHLVFKLNALADRQIIQLLYQASQAGVRVDLIVRGICCLRPGLPGLSDNIRVTSVVGRFLEHSRIFYFRNGGAEAIYLGSADLMVRNIDHRVEILFPIRAPRLVRQVRDEVLAVYMADTVKGQRLEPDGTYVRRRPLKGEPPFNSQAWLLAHRIGEVDRLAQR